LYDLPPKSIPIYIAAAGEESVRIAAQYGDGWITDAETALKPEIHDAFMDSAQSVGKNPDQMAISAELFVFRGTEEEAKPYAELWRFIPNAWTDFVDDPDPRSIMRRAKQTEPIDRVLKMWLVSPDPEKHIQRIQQLIDGGVTNIFIHSGNPDQERFIRVLCRECAVRGARLQFVLCF
jgi:alkanesulfonate monooxygenase SsuD/methylene tetrahydromethanopterin reductase-like flavin-dependent oxidoreductase (luciferase family)